MNQGELDRIRKKARLESYWNMGVGIDPNKVLALIAYIEELEARLEASTKS